MRSLREVQMEHMTQCQTIDKPILVLDQHLDSLKQQMSWGNTNSHPNHLIRPYQTRWLNHAEKNMAGRLHLIVI